MKQPRCRQRQVFCHLAHLRFKNKMPTHWCIPFSYSLNQPGSGVVQAFRDRRFMERENNYFATDGYTRIAA